eukprot:TRINITY_DN23435_c0_g1_i1.p1 TRINITY_DN23435_c0_g1~~TRINITY_DN23435_c0_g1_i1.p1  ORF type:complete len:476 (+),score=117.97 TRINITY_DN23435_c0_g1_i1:109-1536(+)
MTTVSLRNIAYLAVAAGAFFLRAAALVYNENVEWGEDLDAAIQRGKKEDKPVLALVYADHCPVCVQLRDGVSPPNGADFERVSKDFVMVKTKTPPNTPDWTPDGDYVPRVLFLKDDGAVDVTVRNEIDHRADGMYHYTYTTEHAIVGTMERVLEHRHRHRTDALHYNEEVDWKDDLTEALELQKVEKKPLMALIYSDHCPVCHNLRDSLTPPKGGPAFVKASKNYIMVMTKEPPNTDDWAPDGRYVPRIMFVKDGVPDPAVINHVQPRSDGYHYTYTSERALVLTMDLFAETQYGIGAPDEGDDEYEADQVPETPGQATPEVVPEVEGGADEYDDTIQYNSKVDWEEDIEAAIQRQKVEDKPMMVLFYGDHCPTCHRLAVGVSPPHGSAFAKVSRDFIMVKTKAGHPEEGNWGPDGFYIPRVLFVKDGKVDTSVTNDVEPRSDGYRYTYTSERALSGMMHKVLEDHHKEQRDLEF